MILEIKKFCLLLCLFNQVSKNNGSAKSPKLFEDLLLKEIIHSIDVASDSENLFEIVLKLLNSVCACMQETLHEKQNSVFNIETNILRGEDDENYVSNIDLYKKIYNRTCVNLKQKVMKKLNENYNIVDINGNKLNKRQFYIDKITKEKMERTLFEILIKNHKNREYRMRNLDSYKNKIMVTNKNEYNVIIIITLYPNTIEDLNNYKNLSEYQFANAFTSHSPVDIDLIRTPSFQNSDKTPKFAFIKSCYLYSIYNFLSECSKNNTVKMFKFLKVKKSLKIYINTIAHEDFDIYMNKCCSNEYVCESLMFKNTFKSVEMKLIPSTEKYNNKLDDNYQNIINNIKMLIYQYAKKFSHTKILSSLEKRSLDDIIKYQSNNCDLYKSINYSISITTSYSNIAENKIQVKKHSTEKNYLTTIPYVFTESISIPRMLIEYLQAEKRISSVDAPNISFETITPQVLTTGLPNKIRRSTVSDPIPNNVINSKLVSILHVPPSSTKIIPAYSTIFNLKEKTRNYSNIHSSTYMYSNNGISTKLDGNKIKYPNKTSHVTFFNNVTKNLNLTFEQNKLVTKPTKITEFVNQAIESNNAFLKVNFPKKYLNSIISMYQSKTTLNIQESRMSNVTKVPKTNINKATLKPYRKYNVTKMQSFGESKSAVSSTFLTTDNKIGLLIGFNKNNELEPFKRTTSQEFTIMINNRTNELFLSTHRIDRAFSSFKSKLRTYSKPQSSIFENKNIVEELPSITLPTKIKYIGNITKLNHNKNSLFSTSPNKSILYSANAVPRSITNLIQNSDASSKFTSKPFEKKEVKKTLFSYKNGFDFIKYFTKDYGKNATVKSHRLDTAEDFALYNVKVSHKTNTVRETTIDEIRDLTTHNISYTKTKNIKDSAINYATDHRDADSRTHNVISYLKSFQKVDVIEVPMANSPKYRTIHSSITASNNDSNVTIIKSRTRNTLPETTVNIYNSMVKQPTTYSVKDSVINNTDGTTKNNAKLLQANSTMDITKHLITDISQDYKSHTVNQPITTYSIKTLTTHSFKSSTEDNVKYRKTDIIKDPIDTSKYIAKNTKKNVINTIILDPTTKTRRNQTIHIAKDSSTNTITIPKMYTTGNSRIGHLNFRTSHNMNKNLKGHIKTPIFSIVTDHLSQYTTNTRMVIVKNRTIDTLQSLLHVKNRTNSNIRLTTMNIAKNHIRRDKNYHSTEHAKKPINYIKNTKDTDGENNHTKNNITTTVRISTLNQTTNIKKDSTQILTKELSTNVAENESIDIIIVTKTEVAKYLITDLVKNFTTATVKYITMNSTRDFITNHPKDYTREPAKSFIINIVKSPAIKNNNISTTENKKYYSMNAANDSTMVIEKCLLIQTTAKSVIDTKREIRMDVENENIKNGTKYTARYSTANTKKNPTTAITKNSMTYSLNDRTLHNLKYFIMENGNDSTKDDYVKYVKKNNVNNTKIVYDPTTNNIIGSTADSISNNTTTKRIKNHNLDKKYNSTTYSDFPKYNVIFSTENYLNLVKMQNIYATTPCSSRFTVNIVKKLNTIDGLKNVKYPTTIVTKYLIGNNEKDWKIYTAKDTIIDTGMSTVTTTTDKFKNSATSNVKYLNKTEMSKYLTMITKKAHTGDTQKNPKVDILKSHITATTVYPTPNVANSYVSYNANEFAQEDVKIPNTNNIKHFTMVSSKHPTTDSIKHQTKRTAKYTTVNRKKIFTPDFMNINYVTTYFMNDSTADNVTQLKMNQVKHSTTIRYDTTNSSYFLINTFKKPTTDYIKHYTTESIKYPITYIATALTKATVENLTANTTNSLSPDASTNSAKNVAQAPVTTENVRESTIDNRKQSKADILEIPTTLFVPVLTSDTLKDSTVYTVADIEQDFTTNIAPISSTETIKKLITKDTTTDTATVLLIDTVIHPITHSADAITLRTLNESTTSNKQKILTDIAKHLKKYNTKNNANNTVSNIIHPSLNIIENLKTDNVKSYTIHTAKNLSTDKVSDPYGNDITYFSTYNKDSTASLINMKKANKSSKALPVISKYMSDKQSYLSTRINMVENSIFDEETKQNSSEKWLTYSIISKDRKFKSTNNHTRLPTLIKEVKELITKAAKDVVNNYSNISKSTNFKNFTTQLFTSSMSSPVSNYTAMINMSNNKKNTQVTSSKHVVDITSRVTGRNNYNKFMHLSNTTVKYRRSRLENIELNALSTYSSKYPLKKSLRISSTHKSTRKSISNSSPLYLSAFTEPLSDRTKPTTSPSMKLSVRMPGCFNKRNTDSAYTHTTVKDNSLSMENFSNISNKVKQTAQIVNVTIFENDLEPASLIKSKITTPLSLILNTTKVLQDRNNLLFPVVTASSSDFNIHERQIETNSSLNYSRSRSSALLNHSLIDNVEKTSVDNSQRYVTIERLVSSTKFETTTLPIITKKHNKVTLNQIKTYVSDKHYITSTEAHIAHTSKRNNILSSNKPKAFNYPQMRRKYSNLPNKGENVHFSQGTEKSYKKSKTVRYNTFKPAEDDFETPKKISVFKYHKVNLNTYLPTFSHIESITLNTKLNTFLSSLLSKEYTINKFTEFPDTARHKNKYHRNNIKENLLDPFGKTNLYPINKLPSHTQRKVMKRIRLSKQNRDVLAMDTNDFFLNRRSSVQKLSRPILFNHVPVHSVTVAPKEYVLRPIFEDGSLRPKPLFIRNDNDFYRKDFGLHHHNDAQTLRQKINFIKDSIQVPPEKETTVERPIYLSNRPRVLRDRIDYIRNALQDTDNYRHQSNIVVKPVIEMQNRDPLYYFRRSGLYNNEDISTEVTKRKPTRRRPRTIFFLSPTVPYNRYF